MQTRSDGGPAYKVAMANMTLRDYFATKAMALVPPQNAYNMKDNEKPAAYTARRAYEMADAMLAERAK